MFFTQKIIGSIAFLTRSVQIVGPPACAAWSTSTGVGSSYRNVYMKTDLYSFYEEFNNMAEDSVEDQWTKFKDGFVKIIDKYIQSKTLKYRHSMDDH